MKEVTKILCLYDELIDPKALQDHPLNPNKHTEEQLQWLRKSLMEYDIRHPIIVSRLSGYIVAGHGRKQAAILNNIEKFPVVYQDFKDKSDEYAFMVADNSLAQQSFLDYGMIHEAIQDLGPFDIDILCIPDFKIEPAERDQVQSEKCPACGK